MMKEAAPKMYEAEIPASYIEEGRLNYWISLVGKEEQITYPGGYQSSPWAWDYYHDEVWSVPIIPGDVPTRVFKADRDIDATDFAFSQWSSDYERSLEYNEISGKAAIQVFADSLIKDHIGVLGWSHFIGDIMDTMKSDESEQFIIEISGVIESTQTVTVVLTDRAGIPYETKIKVTPEVQQITLMENDFSIGRMALLPRPYPTFLPYWFEPESDKQLYLTEVENIQLLLVPEHNPQLINKEAGFSVTEIWLN